MLLIFLILNSAEAVCILLYNPHLFRPSGPFLILLWVVNNVIMLQNYQLHTHTSCDICTDVTVSLLFALKYLTLCTDESANNWKWTRSLYCSAYKPNDSPWAVPRTLWSWTIFVYFPFSYCFWSFDTATRSSHIHKPEVLRRCCP